MTSFDYLAGPMRGIDQFNFPMFDSVARFLRFAGRTVVSPAEHDRAMGFDETKNSLDGFDMKEAILWDLEQVANCERIVLLPGWEQSSGVKVELALAEMLHKDVAYYNAHLWNIDVQVGKTHGEVRVTSETGGQKGQKDARLGGVDALALEQLALVAGMGEKKYSRYNYLKGYNWSLSVDALCRHLLAFLNGEDTDPESGLPHTAHVAWHGLALTSFLQRGLGTDDRYKQGEK